MGYGARLLGGYTHKEALSAIPDTAMIWFDKEGEPDPVFAPFSVFKAAAAQPHTAPAYSPVVLAEPPQALSGAGAVSVATHQTNATSTGAAQALTLADGTIVGQLKIVTHVVDGGSLVLTPANLSDGATITFTNVMEKWVGLWNGTNWDTIELSGVTTLPVIA
jgi:hypothetical protein